MAYYRPIVMNDPFRPKDAQVLAGGWCWFTHVERIERGGTRQVIAVSDVPADVLERLSAPRAPIAGMDMSTPSIMSTTSS